jgi:glycosyltransferase involved in cell wall biosynthesis
VATTAAGPEPAPAEVPGEAPEPVPVPVTVAIPLFNDREGIGACLEAVLGQQEAASRVEAVLVVDGGSTDGSREVVAEAAQKDPRVRLLDNPERFVPFALNHAVDAAPSPVIVRVDSHAVIGPDYVDAAVTTLARTHADVVGGPMRPVGDTPVGRAVAWALTSRWGIGGSRFHRDDEAGETDGVYMGVFPRATFERFGRFDERFSRNQDDEFTYRVREMGGRVVLDPAMQSSYSPRADFGALYRQFRGYGRFKPLVLRTHPSGLRLRHLAPPAVALAWAALPLAVVRRRFLVIPLVHVAAVAAAAEPGKPGWLARVRALLTMHLGYGFGFLRGLFGKPEV